MALGGGVHERTGDDLRPDLVISLEGRYALTQQLQLDYLDIPAPSIIS